MVKIKAIKISNVKIHGGAFHFIFLINSYLKMQCLHYRENITEKQITNRPVNHSYADLSYI